MSILERLPFRIRYRKMKKQEGGEDGQNHFGVAGASPGFDGIEIMNGRG